MLGVKQRWLVEEDGVEGGVADNGVEREWWGKTT